MQRFREHYAPSLKDLARILIVFNSYPWLVEVSLASKSGSKDFLFPEGTKILPNARNAFSTTQLRP